MYLSAKITMILAAVFAVASLGVAFTGFASLGEIADPALAADARGFAWFWMFLAAVAIACGFLSWWMMKTVRESGE